MKRYDLAVIGGGFAGVAAALAAARRLALRLRRDVRCVTSTSESCSKRSRTTAPILVFECAEG